ncbi:MAG: hypothetical protein QM781_17145 [Chitinophagaceae bacterium]
MKHKKKDSRLRAFLIISVAIISGCCPAFASTTISEIPAPIAYREPGQPLGEPVTRIIGKKGGTVVAEDGQLTVEIPAGALDHDVEVGIQLISNTNPAVFGSSYRITPHGSSFLKPVILSFRYQDEFEDKVDPSSLFVSTHRKGKWLAMGGRQIDTTSKRINFSVTHFSDWCMISSMKITPRLSYLGSGESTQLAVVHMGIDPAKLDKGDTLPVLEPRKMLNEQIKSWDLNGPGDLMILGNHADYTAPPSINETEEAEVVATVHYLGGTYLLYAWIELLHPGVYLEVNDKYIEFPNVTQWYNGYISDQTSNGSISIKIHGETVKKTGQWIWKNQGEMPTVFSYSTPVDESGHYYTYTSYYYDDPNANPVDSKGRIYISSFGEKDGYVCGRFVVYNAGKFTTRDNIVTRKATIRGYFRIQRW